MPVNHKDIKLKPPENNPDRPGLFDGLDEKSLELILGTSQLQTFDAGRLLIQQGDVPEYLYYVVEGVVKTYRSDSDGKEATIRILRAGETCMDAVIFMGGASPIAVQVVEAAKILMIPEIFIRKYVLANPQFSTNLLRIVTKHYKSALQQLEGVITKTPLQRLGYYLLKLHLEKGHDALDMDLPFKKSLIANQLGMTPESFSRALKEMKSFGIDIDQEHIKMKDAYALCHFCDTDTAFICTDADKQGCDTCPHKN